MDQIPMIIEVPPTMLCETEGMLRIFVSRTGIAVRDQMLS